MRIYASLFSNRTGNTDRIFESNGFPMEQLLWKSRDFLRQPNISGERMAQPVDRFLAILAHAK